MKRLTFEGNFCDIAMCGEVRGGSFCEDGDCSQRKTWERLKAIEDILCDSVGDNDPDAVDEYDLDRLAVMCNQRMSMRDEVSERFSLTAKIPLDRLRELVEAEREGRCVVLPCKPGDTVWRLVSDATPHITKDQCLTIMLDNGSMWVDLLGASMNGLYFGQRLFLTRAEAKAALKARKQDG